ncbi:helix-turn-helix domain-containing protein [Streptomyces marianii]|uniref:Helix-turn-helix transcriptional regulator n=1 Tax=Streptomyces marianii TaxID=1817406 RepID=A0A5R9EAR0_9ACTN|nr:helix-turn-helix transcriptional regulator [Streptomyces marianii]TLQ46317.1 helix-turn-helix transcriptional regulator [Streptomyces marianii]
MDAVDALPEDDLEAVVSAIGDLLPQVGMAHDDLDIDAVTYATGIAQDKVKAVLRGDKLDPKELDASLPDRLAFLRETRRRDDGERYTYDQLAERAHVSKALISALFSGTRNPGVPVAGALEDFFRVEPRFLTLSGRRVLARALKPIEQSLITLSLLRGAGVSRWAMRSSIATQDDKLGRALQDAIAEALSAPKAQSDPRGAGAHRPNESGTRP